MNLDGLSGETLAHFRIEHRLGAGGMGIVYRAEDLVLRRPVALKVMRPEQVADERRRARFLREARTAASLVHPNIAAVYEVGDADGAIFIAMELVEGESLRDVLARGPVDVPRAITWATDVARALARAHEAGIVHRDLKPDNVMFTRDGDVKLLDFGIAKALTSESESGDPALGATDVAAMTGEGMLVGTPEYMSPEQTRSARVDVRSDLFSFGAVLHEMLVGTSPFRRGGVVETAIAIGRDAPPPLRRVRPEVPADLEAIVTRCLAKEPSERFANGGELLVALRAVGTNRTGSLRSPVAETMMEASPSAVSPAPPRGKTPVIAAVAIAAVGVAVVVGARRHAPGGDAPPASASAPIASASPPPTYVDRVIGSGRETNGWEFALSPDGARIVFDDGTGVWLQELPAGGRVPLPVPAADVNDVGAVDFIGPDRIAYVTSSRSRRATELWTLGLRDGAPKRIRSDALTANAASVSPDGRAVVYVTSAGVHVGPVDGPTPKRIVTYGEHDFVTGLGWSTDSSGFLFIHTRMGDDVSDVVWSSADGEHVNEVLRGHDLVGHYGGGGLAFASPERVLLMRYDRDTSRLVELTLRDGARVGAERELHRWEGELIDQPRVGGRTIVYPRGTPNGSVLAYALSRDGERIDGPSRALYDGAWVLRPIGFLDDTHVAVVEEQDRFFHVLSVSTSGTVEPYVRGPLSSAYLVPGGDVLYWTKDDGGACTLHRHSAKDGTESPAPMAGTTCDEPIHCVSGRCIAVEESVDLVTSFREWDATRGATGPALLSIAAPRVRSAVSDDGRWIAVAKRSSGVTLYDLAHGGAAREVPTTIPERAQWLSFTRDSKTLVFTGAGNPDVGGSFFATASMSLDGKVRTLFTDRVRWSTQPRVSPDGRTLVVGQKNFGSQLWMMTPR